MAQAGTLPHIDLVRISGGTSLAVNLNRGQISSAVSMRATGFRQMMEKFEFEVGVYGVLMKARLIKLVT